MLRQAQITGTRQRGRDVDPGDRVRQGREDLRRDARRTTTRRTSALASMVDGRSIPRRSSTRSPGATRACSRRRRRSRGGGAVAARGARGPAHRQRRDRPRRDPANLDAVDSDDRAPRRRARDRRSPDAVSGAVVAPHAHRRDPARPDRHPQRARRAAIAGGATAAATAQRRRSRRSTRRSAIPSAPTATARPGARRRTTQIAESAREVRSAIMETQAIAVALRTYAHRRRPDGRRRKNELQTEIETATNEARAIEDELAEIDRELVLGKDLVGRRRCRLARARASSARSSRGAGRRATALREPRSSALADQAARIVAQLEQIDATDRSARRPGHRGDQGHARRRSASTSSSTQACSPSTRPRRARSARRCSASSFKDVKAKFDDVVVRTDVGIVDVAWSQKEDSDDDFKRLNLAKQPRSQAAADEFRFVLDENTPTPGPAQAAEPPPAASTEGGASPDKGGAPDTRVKPAGHAAQGHAAADREARQRRQRRRRTRRRHRSKAGGAQ